MSKTVKSKILLRRDTSQNWEKNNPILAAGEVGFDTTVKKHKIGDGQHRWIALPYFALETDLDDRITFIMKTKQEWQLQGREISQRGVFYIYTNNEIIEDENNQQIQVPGIKIGDGLAYICDLPFITDYLSQVLLNHINDRVAHITQGERQFWNNKVTSYINKENPNNLVFDKGTLFLE